MTKDYKKVDKEAPKGGYGWMLSGIALGLLVGLGMYFYTSHNQSAVITENVADEVPVAEVADEAGMQEPDPISVVIESARLEQQDRKRATFSYYAVLPNLELDVTVPPSAKDVSKESLDTEKMILKPGSYILQIASFRTQDQARRSQVNLHKKGVETHIEKRRIKGNDWFRVFAGPTEQSEQIDQWKRLVQKSGYKPLIVTVK